MAWCVVREEREAKKTSEESVVGGVVGKGLIAERLKGVVMGHRRGREECREKQRAKIGGRVTGRRDWEIFKFLGGGANGKRRIFWG